MKINDATIEAALNARVGADGDTVGSLINDEALPFAGATRESVMRIALTAAEAASDIQADNYIYRDAVTGRIVSADYARDNPDTTTRERV